MIILKTVFLSGLFFLTINCFPQQQRTINGPLPSRQVHLDFHTSEFIPGIGEKFNKKQFQEALKLGHVNQINFSEWPQTGFKKIKHIE